MANLAATLHSRMVNWFDEGALESAIEAHFAFKRPPVKDEHAMYQIDEAFGGQTPYWKIHNSSDRFLSTDEHGVLYRPCIVNDIVKKIEYSIACGGGVMIRGPHGVGKSLSLVNVVRKLESTGNYLVTFLSDCQFWRTVDDLYDAMCRSFGSTREALNLGVGFSVVDLDDMSDCHDFINAVRNVLEKEGRKWVFIFDQMNCLYERLDRDDVRDFIGSFGYIYCSQHEGCITSVISVTANNETNYEQDQTDFKYYDHPIQMVESELLLAFPHLLEKSDTDLESLFQLTGTMPLQVYLHLQAGTNEKYRTEELKRITTSLYAFKERARLIKGMQRSWEGTVKTAIYCFLHKKLVMAYRYPFLDRNHCVVSEITHGNELVMPVNPLVLEAYAEFFRDDFMNYIEHRHEEGWLLSVCRDPQVTDDLRGRTFELLELIWEWRLSASTNSP